LGTGFKSPSFFGDQDQVRGRGWPHHIEKGVKRLPTGFCRLDGNNDKGWVIREVKIKDNGRGVAMATWGRNEPTRERNSMLCFGDQGGLASFTRYLLCQRSINPWLWIRNGDGRRYRGSIGGMVKKSVRRENYFCSRPTHKSTHQYRSDDGR